MTSRTTTKVTHYAIQKERRAALLAEWRACQKTVVRLADVEMADTPRGTRIGVYTSEDGDRPTRTMDALAHEISPDVTSAIHRHSWDAMVLIVAGSGWTEIDGRRINWVPGDSLHLPAWAWHRSGNEGAEVARYLTFSSEPMLSTMGMSVVDDRGHTPFAELPGRPPFSVELEGVDPYSRRVSRLAREQSARRSGRLHTRWDELELLQTPRGTRTTFLLDRAIGYQASGITMAMFEIGPGRGQSMHRHPGEAWLYVLEGEGHSYLGVEPEGGENHPWKKGDLIVVDHFLWHQHFNDSATSTAKVVRIHMFDSLLDTMRVLMDPVVLFEEPPDHVRDAQAGDYRSIEWPTLERPTWP